MNMLTVAYHSGSSEGKRSVQQQESWPVNRYGQQCYLLRSLKKSVSLEAFAPRHFLPCALSGRATAQGGRA